MTDEEFVAWLHRQGKPETKVLESWKYGDPLKFARYGKRGEAEVDRQSDKEKADTLLMEWYRWTKTYRPNLGAPRIAPYCKQATSSQQYDDPSDLNHDKVYQNEMKAIQYCVDALDEVRSKQVGQPSAEYTQVICREMRNREVNAKVWRSPSNKTYAEALDAVLPVMKKRGLFD